MHVIWNYIAERNWYEKTKYKVVSLITSALFALAGLAVWVIIQNWMLSTWEWMVCFIGYPIVISWFVVFFYSCRHTFHTKR